MNNNFDQISRAARTRRTVVRAVTYALLALWALLVLFPYYWMLLTSVKSYSSYNAEYVPAFFTLNPTLENYASAFSEVPLARYFMNSILFTVVTTGLMMLVIVPAAFAFSRLEFRRVLFRSSSLGIIIRARNSENTRSRPLNCSRAKAKAAGTITSIISAVVTTVKTMEFMKYRASGTWVKALA